MSTPIVAALALIVGIVIGAAVFYFLQRSRSLRLRQRFGPEYERTVTETGDRWTAERDLERRQRRVERLHIRPLDPAQRAHYEEAWRDLQAQFVENPESALAQADRLISEVMTLEGYPVQDFEQRAADVSVEHPRVVENYREGHLIAVRHTQGSASTEELRKAMIHYRALFEDLLHQPEFARAGGGIR